MKIVYKVVTAVLAACILPLIIFLPIIDYCFNTPLLEFVEPGKKYIADSISVAGLLENVSLLSKFETGGNTPAGLKAFINPALTAVVFLILIAVFAILTCVLAIVMKKGTGACISVIYGMMCTYMFTVSFNSLVKPLTDGSVSIASLFDSWQLALVGSVEYIKISGAYYYIYIMFAAILVWTLAYYLTIPKEDTKSSYRAKQ
ncbi:MAG: hypothetical protein BWY46_00225 [Firmicutes bacterium ADurb.Bin300]|nr:MAG: hypothetical protein BWY46_00225 [Firmicutes bacterium ADurb.Bin300]